jgi:hypothetical protein
VPFLPPEFEPPVGLEHARFRLRPITVDDLDGDYDAVMSSHERLWRLFGKAWGWPPADLTLEQDRADLAWHEEEARLGRSFNYAVVSLEERRLLGCVYVDPPTKEGFDAELFWWVRSDEVASGLEDEVGAAARDWVMREWPFRRIACPGRDIPWAEYRGLPNA